MDGRVVVGMILLGMSAISWRLFGSWFCPSAFWSTLWGLLYLGQALLAPNYLFWGPGAAWIVAMNGLFGLGALLAWFMTASHPMSARKEKPDRFVETNFRRWFTVIAIVGMLGGGASIAYSVRVSGVPNLGSLLTVGSAIRASLQETSAPPLIRYSTYFNYIGSVLGGIYLSKFGFRRRMFLPLLVLVLDGLTAQAKAGILIAVTMYAWGTYVGLVVKHDSRRDFYMIGMGGMLLVGMLPLVAIVASLRNARVDWQFIGGTGNQLDIVYNYAFGSVTAFDYYFTFFPRSDLFWGRQSLAGLADLVGLYARQGGLYSEHVIVDAHSGGWTNVFTMFRYLIDDFGLIGTSGIVLVLGWGMTFIYRQVVRSYQVNDKTALLACGYVLLTWFPITALTAYNSFIATTLLSTLVLMFCTRWVVRFQPHRKPAPHLAYEKP